MGEEGNDTLTVEKLKYRKRQVSRHIARHFFERRFCNIIDTNKDARILVILHLYYEEAWPEIKEYLSNLRCYNYDLLVSLTSGRIGLSTRRDIEALEGCDVRIIDVPNRGFDLGPFFETANLVTEEYDVVFKIHSKATKRPIQFIYGRLFFRRTWFLMLFDGVLGARNVHRIINFMAHSHEKSVIAAPQRLIVRDPAEKQQRHLSTGRKLGLQLTDDYEFVAGTCFAMNGSHFKAVRDLDVTIDQFDVTDPRSVWDLGHFLERYVCNLGRPDIQFYKTSNSTIQSILLAPLEALASILYPVLRRRRNSKALV